MVGDDAYGAAPQLGVILGIATAICYAGYLLIIRWGGRDPRRPAGPVAIATLLVAICAFAVGQAVGDLDLTPPPASLFWLAVLGITAQSAGYLLISISLPRLPAIITSVILLSQPVMSMGLAIVLLGETPSAVQLLGVGPGRSAGSPAATIPVGADPRRVESGKTVAGQRLTIWRSPERASSRQGFEPAACVSAREKRDLDGSVEEVSEEPDMGPQCVNHSDRWASRRTIGH